jgi:hypothetical protein
MTYKFAPNTLKAYAMCWKTFTAWCGERGCSPLPAIPETVEDYLTWGASERTPAYSLQSLNLGLNAIRHYHRQAKLPFPRDPAISELLTCLARKAAQRGARGAGRQEKPGAGSTA